MIYLFAAFTVVWIGIFLYLYLLVRRSEALAHEVARLREQSEKAPPPAASAPVPSGRPHAEPS